MCFVFVTSPGVLQCSNIKTGLSETKVGRPPQWNQPYADRSADSGSGAAAFGHPQVSHKKTPRLARAGRGV